MEPITGVIGQDAAVDALRFGLETKAPGQNVFVRGLTGTGRMTLIRRLLEEIRLSCPLARDRCYVHNFSQPDRPRLISLPRGRGPAFGARVDELADYIRDELKTALSTEAIQARRRTLDVDLQRQLERVVEPFERAVEAAGLALVTMQVGPVVQSALVPRIEGKPVTAEEFEQMRVSGKVTDAQYNEFRQRHEAFQEQFQQVSNQVQAIRSGHQEAVIELWKSEVRSLLTQFTAGIAEEFAVPQVREFLEQVIEDVVTRRRRAIEKETDFTRVYRVNVLLSHTDGESCPIIVETTPTMSNLLGTMDHMLVRGEAAHTDHMMIRPGSLLRADGGYLILEARDVLREPGAWKVLVRTLRTARLEIVPPEAIFPWWGPSLKPEPIDVSLKVVLLGDSGTYYLLDRYDPDFSDLFKVLADFESYVPRDDRGIADYGRVLARIAQEEGLPPFDRTAVAALVEHGARIAARAGKLTTRFGRLADIAREAAFICGKAGGDCIRGDDVRDAVRRSKQRADLPSRRFREMLAEGVIRIETRGAEVGQVNGLAVLSAGPLTYGFPARITATIGPGSAGVINIEREAALSGAIHTKGFYILGGLLRYLLRTHHPLAFDASVAFEQSYGGIDGDSASGAEICCLLSALTDIPLRQDLAMTGAIDQVGHILAIGAVNEKIEGFFETCRDMGLTGTQGVIIPQANAGDLMLRHDVVEACAAGNFTVYSVGTVHEALELLTGIPAGSRGPDGWYPEGTVLGRAVERAFEYWVKAAQSVPVLTAPAKSARRRKRAED
ncbi:MAG: AAA family ATPase [Planctomycetes bacterium]|nr:AAA family ATPase [Planctomycetota bacterium]